MILSTTDSVPGREVIEILGLVKGNTVRARNIGRAIVAGLKNVVGGEISEYTKLMAESREQALDRMIVEAQALRADAIIEVRMATAEVLERSAEILVYGTAVRLR